METERLISKYPIISDQINKAGLQAVLTQLERVLQQDVSGDIVELGCYIGTTSLFIRRLLDTYEQSDKRAFHVYDSFEGLPPKTPQDSSAAGVDFKAGELSVSKRQFIEQFKRSKLNLPVIHKGWFDDLTAPDMPEQIAFAFLDGDFYSSIISSLRLVWPRMSPGGIITVDDYRRETLPGVERALQDFLQGKSYRLRQESNIAVIVPAAH